MRLVSTRSNSVKGRKLDEKKKSHQSECPLRGDKKKEFLKKIGIGLLKKKSYM
jgi:hypothetical protein